MKLLAEIEIVNTPSPDSVENNKKLIEEHCNRGLIVVKVLKEVEQE